MKGILIGVCVSWFFTCNAWAALTSKYYVDAIIDALQSDVAGKANDADVVHLDGDETISGFKTFTKPVLVNSGISERPIMTLTGSGSTIYFSLLRSGGSEAILESGYKVALFGTKTNHPVEIRTNYQPRMTIGTDGRVVLAVSPSSNDNSNQIATTAWVNERIKTLCAASESE